MPLSWIIIAVLAASPFLTYGVMAVREKIVVSAAVRAEKTRAEAQCDARVYDMARKQNEAVAAAVAAAREAANSIEATPEEFEKLKEVCNRSASCRKEEM